MDINFLKKTYVKHVNSIIQKSKTIKSLLINILLPKFYLLK